MTCLFFTLAYENKTNFWGLNSKENRFELPKTYNRKHYFYGIDYFGRPIQYNNQTKEYYIGTKTKPIILSKHTKGDAFQIKPGGKFIYFTKKDRIYIYDVLANKTIKFPEKTTPFIIHPSTQIIPDGFMPETKKLAIYDLYSKDIYYTDYEGGNGKTVPKQFQKCMLTNNEGKRFYKTQNHFYAFEFDKEEYEKAQTEEKYYPFKLSIYSLEDCYKAEKSIHFSQSAEAFIKNLENLQKQNELQQIEDDMAKAKQKEKDKKRVLDVKEFFINFSPLKSNYFDLVNAQGRDISNLKITKEIFGNTWGKIYAIGELQKNCFSGRILLVTINSSNNTDVRIIQVSADGRKMNMHNIASVPYLNGGLSSALQLSFSKSNQGVKINSTRKTLTTGKVRTKIFNAKCGGVWSKN